MWWKFNFFDHFCKLSVRYEQECAELILLRNLLRDWSFWLETYSKNKAHAYSFFFRVSHKPKVPKLYKQYFSRDLKTGKNVKYIGRKVLRSHFYPNFPNFKPQFCLSGQSSELFMQEDDTRSFYHLYLHSPSPLALACPSTLLLPFFACPSLSSLTCLSFQPPPSLQVLDRKLGSASLPTPPLTVEGVESHRNWQTWSIKQ